jgi:hypothetical protein
MGQTFLGMAAIFSKSVSLDGRPNFYEIKGLDLDAVESADQIEPSTAFHLCIGYCGETRSFDVIQSFPNEDTCIGFDVNWLGEVTSFHDHLPSPDLDGWKVIDCSEAFDVRNCQLGEEQAYAQRYAKEVAAAFQRCALREKGAPEPPTR